MSTPYTPFPLPFMGDDQIPGVCPRCHVLVSASNQRAHWGWHDTQDDEKDQLVSDIREAMTKTTEVVNQAIRTERLTVDIPAEPEPDPLADLTPEELADNPAFLGHRHGLAHSNCWCARCEGEARARLFKAGVISQVQTMPNFMHLCPLCGNKRCPRASDHRNACTKSNEPGQAGSVY